MKGRQMLVNKTSNGVNSDIFEQLVENCYIDVSTGEFHCRRCHNIVHIDLPRHYVFCPVHGMLV